MATKSIVNLSLPLFCMDMEAAFEEGFRIDPDNPPCTWGIIYEAILVRDDHVEEVDSVFVAPVENVVIENVQQAKKSNAGRPAKVKQ